MAFRGVFRGHAKLRAAMAADVVERTQGAFAIADHENGFAGNVDDERVARMRHLFFAGNTHPGGGEEVFLFEGEDLVAKIKRRRKCGLKRNFCRHIDQGSKRCKDAVVI